MKKLVIILALSLSLFGAPFFTLDNLDNLRIFFMNKTDFIDKSEGEKIKGMAEKKLKAAGFRMNEVDASTFMIKIESIKLEKKYVVNTTVAIGEEIITNRKESPQTFAFTYYMNDLIDTDEPYEETMESIEFLMDAFIEAYNDDKE